MEDRFQVLVVEDDPSTIELLVRYLEVGGFDVATATSGEEALRVLESVRPELIISDVDMGGMDGYELCRRVRANGLSEVPFIFVSALGSLPQRIKGLKVGADDYLPKPVDPEELILKVETLIKKNRRMLEKLRQAEGLSATGVMKGRLGEIGITSLLQLFDLADAGEIHIRVTPPEGRSADVWIKNGRLIHVALGELSGQRAVFRLLEIQEGEFMVQRGTYEGDPTMAAPIQRALLDGVAKLDEYRRLVENPEDEAVSFRVNEEVEAVEGRFGGEAARLLELVDELHDLDDVLAASPLPELETLRALAELQQANAIRQEEGGR